MTLTLPLITDWRCSTSFLRQMSRKRLLLFQSRLFFTKKVFSNTTNTTKVPKEEESDKRHEREPWLRAHSYSLSPNHKKSSLFLEMPTTEDEHKHKSKGREFKRRKVPQTELIAHPPFLHTGTTSGRRRSE